MAMATLARASIVISSSLAKWAHDGRYGQWAHDGRYGVETGARVLQSLFSMEVGVGEHKRVVVLDGALNDQSRRALLVSKHRVRVHAPSLAEVLDDDRRIGDTNAIVSMKGSLPRGATTRVGSRNELVGHTRNAQPGLELAAERGLGSGLRTGAGRRTA
jgi:hypothetical protein